MSSQDNTDNHHSKVNHLPNDQVFQNPPAFRVKQYPFFYLVIVFLIVSSMLAAISSVYSYKYKNDTSLLINDLTKVESQLLEQQALLSALQVTKAIFERKNIDDYLVLDKQLTTINKRLSLLSSKNQTVYQDWKVKRQSVASLLRRIQLSDEQLKALHESMLTKLKLVKEAVDAAKEQAITPEAYQKLVLYSQNVNKVFSLLNELTILTSPDIVETIEKLILSINEPSSFALDVEVDSALTQFTNIFYLSSEIKNPNETFVSRWQKHLQLITQYNHLLLSQAKVFTQLLYNMSENTEKGRAINLTTSIPSFQEHILSNMNTVVITALTVITLLFWLFFRHMKNYIVQCQDVYMTQYNSLNGNKATLISDREQKLTLEIEALLLQQDKLKLENELAEFTAISHRKTNIIIEQKNYAQLYNLALKQSENLALASFSDSDATKKQHLFQVYLLGKILATSLKQARYHRYIQADDMVLTLSDVNLIATTEAILLNQTILLSQYGNSLNLKVDGKIYPEVKIDVDVFTEMLQVFTQLLSEELTGGELDITLKLQDKNDGQQKILIAGQVVSVKKIQQLPILLQQLQKQTASNSTSELNNYFFELLKYLHGENVAITLTEKGYQLSFSLPLAIMLNRTLGESTSIQLTAAKAGNTQEHSPTFYARPIEILLGVSEPAKHKNLQQLIQYLGLQVTLVAQAARQNVYWQSGRYAILISEFTISPFIGFSYKGDGCSNDSSALQRGVFSLQDNGYLQPDSDTFAHWVVDKLSRNTDIEKLITKLSPWLQVQKKHQQAPIQREQGISSYNDLTNIIPNKLKLEEVTDAKVINFELYIQNQGAPELAFFMLDVYINDCFKLFEKLKRALEHNNSHQATISIQGLKSVSEILATPNLLDLCHDWQKLLSDSVLNKNSAFIGKLLVKTKQEITNVATYAKAI